jgi:hypothetical protein
LVDHRDDLHQGLVHLEGGVPLPDRRGGVRDPRDLGHPGLGAGAPLGRRTLRTRCAHHHIGRLPHRNALRGTGFEHQVVQRRQVAERLGPVGVAVDERRLLPQLLNGGGQLLRVRDLGPPGANDPAARGVEVPVLHPAIIAWSPVPDRRLGGSRGTGA